MNAKRLSVVLLTLGLFLIAGIGISMAQESNGGGEVQGPFSAEASVAGYIPIQGKLTDANGNSLNGDYSITFTLYDALVGGIEYCSDTLTIPVNNGLFSTNIGGLCNTLSRLVFTGNQLYMEIEVEGETMTPRQPIYPVPYAFSLRPGAKIIGDFANMETLWVENTNSTGIALKVSGSGIIQSTANSYLWVSGNSLQKGDSDEGTRFEYDFYGGYKVSCGVSCPVDYIRHVVMPITIPGQLYGQNITVTGLDLYYTVELDSTVITLTGLRRQDGVNAGDVIFVDNTNLTCSLAQHCVQHWDLTQNNTLSDQQGILHFAMWLDFSGGGYIQIGGIRLTLTHD